MNEIAWAAGFFDGEGSASVARPKPCRQPGSRGGRRGYLYLSVGQAERSALERFKAAVGLGNVTGPTSAGMFRWYLSGRRAECVADLLFPYLSGPKRAQIAAARAAL